tara:strand:+ start:1876 stop:2013 length:138 start_codon:yes stop_codon:yes gene_type:complete
MDWHKELWLWPVVLARSKADGTQILMGTVSSRNHTTGIGDPSFVP